MKREEVVKQLKELIEDRKSFMAGDYDDCYDKDVQALEYAIKELERTAQEVPVQEQLDLIEANNLLSKKFKEFASRDELSELELKKMLEIYSILFPFHP